MSKPARAASARRRTSGSAKADAPKRVSWASDAVKIYGHGGTEVKALDGVSVAFASGSFNAIMGPSGSGKSTLLHCLAGLDRLTRGTVWLGDTDLTTLDEKALTALRRDRIGFVFQSFNLVPTLNAIENIRLPLDIAGRNPDPGWLDTIIDTIGLRDRLQHRPSQLSGGEQQRVAAARALVARPEVVFADEPTGNLNTRASAQLLGFMREAVRRFGQTIVMVTHDPVAASYADRVVFLRDGRTVGQMSEPSRKRILETLKELEV
jgi:putative ABC transport system ATP-binding protein